MTFFGKDAEKYALKKGSIVAIKNAKVNEYNGNKGLVFS